MPISYPHKTIFVHIPKTAGTSIYTALEIPYEYNRRALMTMARITPCQHHLTPLQIKAIIPEEIWNTFYKFTIVRNPYDRAVSDYHFLLPILGSQYNLSTFDKFITLMDRVVTTNSYTENSHFDHFRPQSHYFKGIKYNYIGRFENLNEDIKKICTEIGSQGTLPWVNKSIDRQNYRNYYNERTRSIIERLYASDLEMFGYRF